MLSLKSALWLVVIVPVLALSADVPQPDRWASVRFLLGSWEGTSEGEPGRGTVTRRYEFVLGERFIHERNTSTYAPQEKNRKGEVHEHWSFISYDRARKALILRQFHQEGFVNQYVHKLQDGPVRTIVFESESFENLDASWRARETYEVLGPDEFTEAFELSEPGKPFELYSKNHLKRVRR